MSRSTDAGLFFQTTAALDESARKVHKAKNKLGNPIKLPSKILAIAADPYDAGAVYVAEAAGTVKRVLLETSEVAQTFRPNTSALAPLTCLAISTIGDGTLFAGSWDKTIYCWPLSPLGNKPPSRLTGHSDFVKALLSITSGSTEILISASSDASIVVWDVASGTKLHTLKGHSRGVTALALESVSLENGSSFVTIFSGDSNREIRRWNISTSSSYEITTGPKAEEAGSGPITPLLVHETSIYSLKFDSDGDLWTASADKTAKCLSRSHSWDPDTTLQHPDFVRDIVIDEPSGWIATACRDEEVRVWERASGKLFHIFSGHYEEVTGLVLLEGSLLVSVSIDGTVRQWSLKRSDLERAVEEAKKPPVVVVVEEEEKPKVSALTEEEERELAELMDDSE